jgi:hypothetical protein
MSPVPRFDTLTLTQAQRAAFLGRVRPQVSPEDYRWIEGMSHALPELLALIEQPPMTLNKLRHLLFGPKTETTDRVCPAAPAGTQGSSAPKRRRPGHGRTRARAYTGARWIEVPHPSLQAGQRCHHCQQGTLRAQKSPALALRIVGTPPISATGYVMARLRCDTCGQVFTAPTPPEAGTQKYDPSVGVTVALLRYGCGMPHYRLARLQQSLGVPLPESTQWELMQPLFAQTQPVWEELIAQAANAPVIHHDDTPMRILDLRRPGSATAAQVDPQRKGTFTSNLLAEVDAHPVALYFTGWQHAGENLAAVLRQRAAGLEAPIQMCDALSRNVSPKAHTVVAQAKELQLNPEQRLFHHQTHSQPVMQRLQSWMQEQLDDRLVEPNSGLGQAMTYLLKHWEPLTLFLRQPGAPLDNNACERALKRAILHRKNSLSYKTLQGAQTGDRFMSLIHTCRLNRVNPLDYLLALATHADAIKLIPRAWLPWNYPKAAAQTDTS